MREPKGTKTLEYNSFNAPGIQTFIELALFESHFLLGTDSVSRSRDSFLRHPLVLWGPSTTRCLLLVESPWPMARLDAPLLDTTSTLMETPFVALPQLVGPSVQHNQTFKVWDHHLRALLKHHISWLSPPAPAPLYQTDTEALSCPGETEFTVIMESSETEGAFLSIIHL